MAEDLTLGFLERFKISGIMPGQYNILALAYIGDTVYELLNRTENVAKHDVQVQKLHKMCTDRANASAQARFAEFLEPLLTEEEHLIYKRGRNADVYSKPKNASIIDYHKATGLEALVGYLYLKGQYDRLTELLYAAWSRE